MCVIDFFPTPTQQQQHEQQQQHHHDDGDEDALVAATTIQQQEAEEELERVKAALQATGQALSQNAQYICRQLKENPRVSGFALKVERERAGLVALLEAVAEELQATAGGFAGTLCSKVRSGGGCGWIIWDLEVCDADDRHLVRRRRRRRLRRSTSVACWRRSGTPRRRCSGWRAVRSVG